MVVQTHVLQHHDTAEQQRSRVGKLLAGDIWRGSVDSLEDGALVADVSGGSETKTTDQAGAQIGQNVAVEIGHDENLVVVGRWIRDHLQAGVIEQLGVELDVGEFLADLASGVQEQAIGHLHDGGLVHGADLAAANLLGVLEREAEDAFRCLAGDELDRLDDTVDNDVLDSGVFSFRVLTDQHGVDAVVRSLKALDRFAGTDVGEEVESSAEGEIEGDMSLANGGL